jgi:arsenical pump membrane protein
MIPVNIASVVESLGVLFLYFRRSISAHYDVSQLKAPNEAIRDQATSRAG